MGAGGEQVHRELWGPAQTLVALNMHLKQLEQVMNTAQSHLEITCNVGISLKHNTEMLVSVKELQNDIRDMSNELETRHNYMHQLIYDWHKLDEASDLLTCRVKHRKNRIKKMQAKVSLARKQLTTLEINNMWVISEWPKFGIPNGSYDFRGLDMHTIGRRVQYLIDERDRLMQMIYATLPIPTLKDQYDDIMIEKTMLMRDLDELQHILSRIGMMKAEKINTQCKNIGYFMEFVIGNMIHGARATFEELEDEEVCSVELMIRLNDNSSPYAHSHLPEGQKLLSTSALLLSMLLCKPQPFYMLDELDDGLNVWESYSFGSTLRNAVPFGGQVIAVSTQPGTIENGHTVFRTSINNGISMVERVLDAD